jgi:predicted nucleic acid-binding protein
MASDPRQYEIPVDAAIFLRAAELEKRHRENDPADLAILASAEIYDATLVTKDRALRTAAPARAVW